MGLSCDWVDVMSWIIPWPYNGPYSVDSWETSFLDEHTNKVMAYRVISKSGAQLHTKTGAVIQFDKKYAQLLCDAANKGTLSCADEPVRHHRVKSDCSVVQ